VYEGLIGSNTLREHALFVTFFPTVTMGPLLRARPIIAQLRTDQWQGVSSAQVARALALLAMGLAKKIVLADSFGRLADAGYAAPASLSMLEAWGSSLSYSLQLYYDFSGYSDIAMASAMLLGISFPANFNSPYRARSIIEFWQRWHITLSNFITTYLYTPIVRSFAKPTFPAAMFATFSAMLIAGIWHGSTWNFAVFGMLHGAALVVAQMWKRWKRRLPTILAWGLTMAFVNLAFVFFRAPTMSAAFAVLSSMGNFASLFGMETWKLHLRTPDMVEIALPLLAGVALVFGKNSTTVVTEFRPSVRSLGWATALTIVSLLFLNSNTAKEFLYIDF
jgi:alginate O-acetyltransferase complex protein AlgI